MGEYVIAGLAILGVIGCIIAFIKTPAQDRYRLVSPQLTLEAQIASYPSSAQAVIIKTDRKRAFLHVLPYLIFGIVLLLFKRWTKSFGGGDCQKILGFNLIYLNVLIVCYLIPFALFIVGINSFCDGVKTLKTGYFPPLDRPVFKDTIARKGFPSLCYALLGVLFPFFAAYMIVIGLGLFQTYTNGDTHAFQKHLERKCEQK